ncbi:type IV pilin [Haloarchaeobius sp. TZWWS8]|uniref:type IV pilin n=1 Tax=Haloarchaeobius sp. TZWWS8 TaxID=3446121 RepID=UPI003EB77A27
MRSTRAVNPVLGTVLMLTVTLALASVVAVGAFDTTPPPAPSQARFELTADPVTNRLTLTHAGGDALDTTDLRVVVSIDDERLRYQPPVPFFSARGFAPGPTGPFNSASDSQWTAGESASVRLAGTNSPALSPGARVCVELYDGSTLLATVESHASASASFSSRSVSVASDESAFSSVGARARVVMAMSGS